MAPTQRVTVFLRGEAAQQLAGHKALIELLANVKLSRRIAPRGSLSGVHAQFELRLPLAGLVDLADWTARQEKELQALESNIQRMEGKLNSPNFVERAPAVVVGEERRRLADAQARADRIRENLARLRG
ncbi:MAG: hypothetical protein HY335_05465 [Deinococcus sp.]|nr:hypothetical protein [Deinococcus sp.]